MPINQNSSRFFSLFPQTPRLIWDQAKEEVEALEKKMQQLENELAQTQINLETATKNLEEKEKALQNVRSLLRAEL